MYLPNTLNQFLEIYNPSNCLRLMVKVRTINDAMEIKTPSIALMVRRFGQKKIEAYIKLWLMSLNESINLKRPLKDYQIDECAFMIVSNYRNINIADINVIFKRAKSGDYGELYESLSMDKILRWFRDYFDERCEIAASRSRMEHQKIKSNTFSGKRSSVSGRINEDVYGVSISEIKKNIKK